MQNGISADNLIHMNNNNLNNIITAHNQGTDIKYDTNKSYDNSTIPRENSCPNSSNENVNNLINNNDNKDRINKKNSNSTNNTNSSNDNLSNYNKKEKKLLNEDIDDALENYYLYNVCTHDIKDEGENEHYSDSEEIKQYFSEKDKIIKDIENNYNDEKKKKKKKEYDGYKLHNIDTWIIKFTSKTTIFSVGLVLCQLFGGHNLLNIVNKNEVKVVDVLCEWNCKNSSNIYSEDPNITIDDLLPNKGIFSNDMWKSKIKVIIEKCLQFIPSRRCTFKELYEDIKKFQEDYEAYYNINASESTTTQ
ncbi:hypothetical protein PFMALIP_02318 [Plasmodium falciparum MaliPS096_E11]|nr:hypothetical protein PFMALIP_02318 [Plasmodium falciparum MaliPS096_E11]